MGLGRLKGLRDPGPVWIQRSGTSKAAESEPINRPTFTPQAACLLLPVPAPFVNNQLTQMRFFKQAAHLYMAFHRSQGSEVPKGHREYAL